MKTNTYVLTGASSGMGLHIALKLLARNDTHLIIGARDPVAVGNTLSSFSERRVSIIPLDLLSLESVRHFADAANKETSAQHGIAGVICNAGIQLLGPPRLSVDGIDETFAANFLGHFLLVESLRPHLVKAATIITIGSGTHNARDHLARRFGFRGDFFTSAKALTDGTAHGAGDFVQQGMDRYATSKLCAILQARHMASVDTDTLRWFAFDPGLMPGTGLARDRQWAQRLGWRFVMPLMRFSVPGVSSAERSAEALIEHLLLKEHNPFPSGAYVAYDAKLAPASARATDDALAAELYHHCLRLIAKTRPDDYPDQKPFSRTS